MDTFHSIIAVIIIARWWKFVDWDLRNGERPGKINYSRLVRPKAAAKKHQQNWFSSGVTSYFGIVVAWNEMFVICILIRVVKECHAVPAHDHTEPMKSLVLNFSSLFIFWMMDVLPCVVLSCLSSFLCMCVIHCNSSLPYNKITQSNNRLVSI